MSKKNPSWVVISPSLGLFCERCGYRYQPKIPMLANLWAADGRAFTKAHKRCKANASVTENLMTGGEE